MIQVTKRQNKYLLQLADGPKTTRDLMLSQMVTMESSGKMIAKLRNAGLVQSSRLKGSQGNVLIHELIRSYQDLVKDGMEISNRKNDGIPYVEILYVAMLRNGYMTGQELIRQHLKIFPDRAWHGVPNIIARAKALRLCR